MDEARARRLQPHYIELAFKAAFTKLGGRIVKREQGRYEIANVPQNVRAAGKGRSPPSTTGSPSSWARSTPTNSVAPTSSRPDTRSTMP